MVDVWGSHTVPMSARKQATQSRWVFLPKCINITPPQTQTHLEAMLPMILDSVQLNNQQQPLQRGKDQIGVIVIYSSLSLPQVCRNLSSGGWEGVDISHLPNSQIKILVPFASSLIHLGQMLLIPSYALPSQRFLNDWKHPLGPEHSMQRIYTVKLTSVASPQSMGIKDHAGKKT